MLATLAQSVGMKPVADQLILSGLKAETIIGIFPWEQHKRQTLIIQATLSYDFEPAAATDNIIHAIDYALVSTQIIQWIEERSYQLLETVTVRIAELLLNTYPQLEEVSILIEKVGALANEATITSAITRYRS